jgi:YD repeat-containing protein
LQLEELQDNHIEDLTHQLDKNSSGTALASYTYAYDADGRVTSQTVGSSPTVTYTYDNDSQLTSDTTSTQTYHATGNRNGGSNTVGTDNQLTSDGTWDYTHDAAGNETYKVTMYSGVTWEYGYDDKNELISAEEFSRDPRIYDTGLTVLEDVTYKYDAWGNLVERDDAVQLAHPDALRGGRVGPGAGGHDRQHAFQRLGRG